ncbi:single-stranded DNA-binding domain protein [Agrobacterium sp. RAC06]|jgi:single-strand DNA-binding protein|nr:single-stranded DNA-binding domain protein [Agrobacterium sp. RAC06]
MRDENDYPGMDAERYRITCFRGVGKATAEYCEKGMSSVIVASTILSGPTQPYRPL